MSLAVAIQMDPIEAIDIEADSTFVLALEAQAQGPSGSTTTCPRHLSLTAGAVVASVRPLEVREKAGDHFTLGAARKASIWPRWTSS